MINHNDSTEPAVQNQQAYVRNDAYLYASDLTAKETVVEIVKVEPAVFDNNCTVALHFRELPKPLGLSKNNHGIVVGLYGLDTNAWIGKKITLSSYPTTRNGQTTTCIIIFPVLERIPQTPAAMNGPQALPVVPMPDVPHQIPELPTIDATPKQNPDVTPTGARYTITEPGNVVQSNGRSAIHDYLLSLRLTVPMSYEERDLMHEVCTIMAAKALRKPLDLQEILELCSSVQFGGLPIARSDLVKLFRRFGFCACFGVYALYTDENCRFEIRPHNPHHRQWMRMREEELHTAQQLPKQAPESIYLDARDLKNAQATVMIANITEVETGRGAKHKLLHFKDVAKPLMLNPKNDLLHRLYGTDWRNWIGKQLVLYKGRREFDTQSGEFIGFEVPPGVGVTQPTDPAMPPEMPEACRMLKAFHSFSPETWTAIRKIRMAARINESLWEALSGVAVLVHAYGLMDCKTSVANLKERLGFNTIMVDGVGPVNLEEALKTALGSDRARKIVLRWFTLSRDRQGSSNYNPVYLFTPNQQKAIQSFQEMQNFPPPAVYDNARVEQLHNRFAAQQGQFREAPNVQRENEAVQNLLDALGFQLCGRSMLGRACSAYELHWIMSNTAVLQPAQVVDLDTMKQNLKHLHKRFGTKGADARVITNHFIITASEKIAKAPNGSKVKWHSLSFEPNLPIQGVVQ